MHFRVQFFVLRFSRDHHVRHHLPPHGNFLSHFVRRPTSAFHFPTPFALHVDGFLTVFGNALFKRIPVCCGLSLGHPVTYPRITFL